MPSVPTTRPSTRPGNVTYPRPEQPTTLPSTRPGLTPGQRPVRPPVTRPGQNTRPVQRPDFNRPIVDRPGQNRPGGNNNWWNAGNNRPINRPGYRPGGNNNWGNNINSGNVVINNNFQNNINWSTSRNNWGYNPWWNRPATRPWYGSSWNYGWNHHYRPPYYNPGWYGGYRPLPGYVIYDRGPSAAETIGWGLAAWGLGKLIFDSGYNSYSNPYPAQPVPTTSGSQVTYSQPITVTAAQTAPASDEAIATATAKSESFVVESQSAFKERNYLAALESANRAVAESPGDGALHEYRALVLFSLGKFGEAAGVLNPVLISGPGWDWTTMIGLYDSQETYASQLKNLETYATSKPEDASARFLLGYHYMVCGHIEAAAQQFEEASKLQPADTVSKQLVDLLKSSTATGDEAPTTDEEEAPVEVPVPDPVPLEKLTGTWISDKGAEGTITLDLKNDGKFVWTFVKDGSSSDFGGDFSMNDSGLLVLGTDETQMVGAVELPKDDELQFVLAGGPPGDPGLKFNKK